MLLFALGCFVGGLVGVMVMGGVAVRWSRKAREEQATAVAAITTADAETAQIRQDKLDDELRDLD